MKVRDKDKVIIGDQRGMALIVALIMILSLTTIGVIAVNTSNLETIITANTKVSKQAFYLAEAGAERARELLRTRIAGGSTLSGELNALKGSDGVLVNSNSLSNFSNTDDTPFISSTSFGAGSFVVYLTNDSTDGVTSTSDSNGRVTITSFGYGPNNSRAVVQTTVEQGRGVPNLPGAITLPGPNVSFKKGSSAASSYDGGSSHPAVAVNSSTSNTSAANNITGSPDRSSQFTGTGGSPSVQTLDFESPWDSISELQDLYTRLRNNADYTSTSDSGFTLGSTSNRKIVVLNSDYTCNACSGAGILVVTGTLTLRGNFSYDGMILVMGKGELYRSGGGNGTISGGIFVANIGGADGQINTSDDTWRHPTWDTSGGGNSTVTFSATSQSQSTSLLPFLKLSWKQLG